MALTVNGLCSSIATVVAKVTSGAKLGGGIGGGGVAGHSLLVQATWPAGARVISWPT